MIILDVMYEATPHALSGFVFLVQYYLDAEMGDLLIFQ